MKPNNSFVKFTDEDKARAVGTDLEHFLPLYGYELESSGSEKRLKSNHSITVSKNNWYDHAEEKGGNPISLIGKLENLSWKDSMLFLLGKSDHQVCVPAKKQPEKKPFVLPKRNSNNEKLIDYLVGHRKINQSIVEHFITEKFLYQNVMSGAVFVGFDKNRQPQIATIRGTNPDKRFHMMAESSNRDFGFSHNGNINRLYLFESPIDLLSYISLHPKSWEQDSYLCLSGVSGKAVVQFLKDYPNINDLVFCLDNDTAGINADDRIEGQILEEFRGRSFQFSTQKSVGKDWNADLCIKAQKSKSSILSAKKMYQQLMESKTENEEIFRTIIGQCVRCRHREDYYTAIELATGLITKDKSVDLENLYTTFLFEEPQSTEEYENLFASETIPENISDLLFGYLIQLDHLLEQSMELEIGQSEELSQMW